MLIFFDNMPNKKKTIIEKSFLSEVFLLSYLDHFILPSVNNLKLAFR